MEDDGDIREEIFHNTVRENIIFLLLLIILYISSYIIIDLFRKHDSEAELATDEDDEKVYNISLAICTLSLTVTIGAVLLLPFSIASNEVLLLYPKSYYMQWLNHSLVQGLWNHVFLFSNLSLFVFLPFAYFFTESEGFPGHRKGLKARVYETIVVLVILFVFLFGIAFLLSMFFDYKQASCIFSLLGVWNYYLPFLYSCISFVGVSILLLCTPFGFVHLFTLIGTLLKPTFLRNVEEEYLIRILESQTKHRGSNGVSLNSRSNSLHSSSRRNSMTVKLSPEKRNDETRHTTDINGLLDVQRKTSSFKRSLVYLIAMVLLLSVIVVSILFVIHNTIELLIGLKALPNTTRFTLGVSSLSKLGLFGAMIEVVLILCLIVTCTVGLYTIPPIKAIKPRIGETSFLNIVANCVLLLVLSSALPLLSRILGITNFNLLGDYGQIEWLGNFYIVLTCNVLFIIMATGCLGREISRPVRKEFFNKIKNLWHPSSVFGCCSKKTE